MRCFRTSLSVAVIVALAAPAAAERVKFRKTEKPVSYADAEARFGAQWAERPGINRVRVPGNFFLSQPLQRDLPSEVAQRRIRIDLRGDKPTVSDLIALIEAQGVAVAVDWRALGEASDDKEQVGSWTIASRYQGVPNEMRSEGIGSTGGSYSSATTATAVPGGLSGANGSSVAEVEGSAGETIDAKSAGAERGQAKPIAERQAPFRYFDGTIGQLAKRLESAGNISVWYDDGIVIGAQRRYSVSVLQNQDIVQSVVNEMKRLGAQDVVGSVGAGQITYSASPRLADDVLQPYLARVQSNLSEVRLQVAVVAVRMSREAERGFDWSKLNIQFGQTPGVAAGSGAPGDSTGYRGSARTPASLFGVDPSSFEVATQAANIFGVRRPLSVVGAINFLSTLGDYEVTQNVELASISGAPVTLRSGSSIPYATGVQANPIGGGLGIGGTVASSQTDFLETGLTVNFEPRFDADSGIVTIDIGLKLVELESFVDVSVGNQLGSLTQPQVSRQGTNAIVRVPAGQTTIIGGVRRDSMSDDRNGPFGLFGIGSRRRERDVFWLFAVVRPVVTTFEQADMPSGEAVRATAVRETSMNGLPPVIAAPPSVPSPRQFAEAGPAAAPAAISSAPVQTPETARRVPAFITRPMTDAERKVRGIR